MIQRRSLSSHYLRYDQHRDLFGEKLPIVDNLALAILDVFSIGTGQASQIHIVLPPFLNAKAFLECSAFYDESGQVLEKTVAGFSRGSNIVLTAQNPIKFIRVALGDEEFSLNVNPQETDPFDDKNTGLLVINGDAPETVANWLKFYEKHHNLESAQLILCLPWKGKADHFVNALEKHLGETELQIFMIETDAPLGRDAAPKRSIWEAPDAPGKDRMIEPEHDYWASELANAQIFEIARFRYLKGARAVLHVAPSDIIPRRTNQNIFDATLAQNDGFLQLFGERVYPWRIRPDGTPQFKDHCTKRFDQATYNRQWCVNPKGKRSNLAWNPYRIGKISETPLTEYNFWRFMGLRHDDPKDNNPTLAPKTALVLDENLLEFVTSEFEGKDPVLPPVAESHHTHSLQAGDRLGNRVIVTTMKNEGPFLLEWIAYHRAIGFDKFIVYTNDCSDGTDAFLDRLQDFGIVEHYNNPYRKSGMKPQHAALLDSSKKKTVKEADWLICMDCDEFVNIKVGDGTLDALFDAIGDANFISLTWRLFGNGDVIEYHDKPIIEQFNRCAKEITRFPHQAWGVKTLYRNLSFFKKMGVHRPKGLRAEYRDKIKWVNGSGKELPDQFIRNGWRTGLATYGYDLVQLNHYACRSMESFLVKRDRGRVNHVDRDQGIIYWFRMNHNAQEDKSIHRMFPKFHEELDALLAEPDLKSLHDQCVQAHREKIVELLEGDEYQKFFEEINSERVRSLSHYLPHFGMNVFLGGPDTITDEIITAIDKGELNYFNPHPSVLEKLNAPSKQE